MEKSTSISLGQVIPIDPRMELATQQLIDCYSGITAYDVRIANFRLNELTGFGCVNSCTLCQMSKHLMEEHGPEEGLMHKGFCAYCVHHSVPDYPLTAPTDTGRISRMCTMDITYSNLSDAEFLEDEQDVIRCLNDRADFLENLLKLATKHREEVSHG